MNKIATYLAAVVFLLSGCSGDTDYIPTTSSANSGPVVRIGYSVDDYIINGDAIFYDAATGKILETTKTSDFGKFTWTNNVTGIVRVEISGGVEDADGVSSTTSDQKPFSGKISILMNADTTSSPIVISSITTGIEQYANGDIVKYNSAVDLLSPVIRRLVILSDIFRNQSDVLGRLEIIKSATKGLGFASIVSELKDDGQFNNSAAIGLDAAAHAVDTLGARGAFATITDNGLRLCIADSAQKPVADISDSDLRGTKDLNCNGYGVYSTAGIHVLTSLESFICTNCDISDVSDFASIKSLAALSIANNRILSVAPLLRGAFTTLQMNISDNCVTDIASLSGTSKIVTQGYGNSNHQFSTRLKNDAEVYTFNPYLTSTGIYTVLFRTSYNNSANCSIDWGDNTTSNVNCDFIVHRLSHAYVKPPTNSIKFNVSGVTKAEANFPGTPIVVDPNASKGLTEDFNGTAVDTTKWNIDGAGDGIHIGPVSVANGLAEFGAWGRISTKAKVTFSGSKIIIEARMAGQGGSRDTSIQLVDSVSGDYIYSGDTSYFGEGFFAAASGAYNFTQREPSPDVPSSTLNVVRLGGSTNQFMEYRWTLDGDKFTMERGPTLNNITQTATRTLGRSIVGRSFYLSIGTASPDYSPGTWDWVRVSTDTKTSSSTGQLTEDFNGSSIATSNWTSVGFSRVNQPIGSVTVSGGIAEFAAWGRLNTKGKFTISGQKIIIEARMKGVETNVLLFDSATEDAIILGESSYCSWGFYANAGGPYRFKATSAGGCSNGEVLASGVVTTDWMEYRFTVDGSNLKIERGPTLSNITETYSATLGQSISGRSFYLDIGTGGTSLSPASFDWIRASAQ